MSRTASQSGIGKVRNPFTGRYGRLVNADSQLDELQGETAKLTSDAQRLRDEVAVSTEVFIAEMTDSMNRLLSKLEALAEQQTDPEGVRAIARLADRLASQHADQQSRQPKRQVGFIPPSARSGSSGGGDLKVFDQDADPVPTELGPDGLPIGTPPWDDPEGASTVETVEMERPRASSGHGPRWWARIVSVCFPAAVLGTGMVLGVWTLLQQASP